MSFRDPGTKIRIIGQVKSKMMTTKIPRNVILIELGRLWPSRFSKSWVWPWWTSLRLRLGTWRSQFLWIQAAIQDPKSQSASYQEMPWPSMVITVLKTFKNKFKLPIKRFGNDSEGKIWLEVYLWKWVLGKVHLSTKNRDYRSKVLVLI